MQKSQSARLTLSYYKSNKLKTEQYLEAHGHARNVQLFNPVYTLFFDLNSSNHNQIALNHRYHITAIDQVLDTTTQQLLHKDIFIKYSPLLDPLKYMVGKYSLDDPSIRTLPHVDASTQAMNTDSHPKLLSVNNASYVDGFFYFLSSRLLHEQGNFHALDFYGSFLGIQDHFRMNVIDDLEYLSGSPFFMNHLGKIMHLENCEDHPFLYGGEGSKKKKHRLAISDQEETPEILESLDILDLDNTLPLDTAEDIAPSLVFDNDPGPFDNNLHHLGKDNVDAVETDDDDDDDDDDDVDSVSDTDDYRPLDDDSRDDHSVSDLASDEETHDDSRKEPVVVIQNFPVQMICLEKCHGTLDELFEQDKVDEARGLAFMFQIVMALLAYQKTFQFTHNDLHTNNIMYVRTDHLFLWYQYEGIVYRVPTYGYILKIIDFGRAIYQYQGKQFVSDSFAPGGDGATQYNFEPYYDPRKPRVEPNPSFDLCRLGCSIFDFVIDEQYDERQFTPFQQLVYDWCLDDAGKNILYKGKNGRERYPGFKLYVMIARKVHAHTPVQQLKRPCFRAFCMGKPTEASMVMPPKGGKKIKVGTPMLIL